MQEWIITAGVFGGLFIAGSKIFNPLYRENRPIVEGIVAETNFSNKEDSYLVLDTGEEYLHLTVGTKYHYGRYGSLWIPLVDTWHIGGGKDYRRKAKQLDALIQEGEPLRALVHEKKGLERQVYEILDIPNPDWVTVL